MIKAEDRISTINKEPCELASYKARNSRYKNSVRFTQSDCPSLARKLSRLKSSGFCNDNFRLRAFTAERREFDRAGR